MIRSGLFLKTVLLAAVLGIACSSRQGIRRMLVIQVRKDGGLDKGSNCGDSKNVLEPGYTLRVELIGFPGRLHVSWYLTERSSRRQAGAEERRTEMRKVMEILCHSMASAKNTRDRGHCNLTGHETGKTKDPVR